MQERLADGWSYFKFTAAERDRALVSGPPLWSRLQFKPDDPCTILLAGQPVIDGFIETRQVAYDANSHAVMLIGKSTPAWPARSSVDTKTGNFDGKTVEQVAREVLAPYAGFVNVKVIGKLNALPFDKLQNQPGEMIWDFLERIARVRGIVLGSDAFGNFLLIGDHTMPVVTDLIEGVNIKKCQAVFTKEHAYNKFVVTGQTAASDSNSGPAASEQRAEVPGAGTIKSVLLTTSEQPVKSVVELYDRARNEEIWNDGTQMAVTITVQGWLRDGKTLWHVGDNVFLKSPMAMLNTTMKIQNAAFSQDNQNGTITTLDLVPPWLLKDGTHWNPGDPRCRRGQRQQHRQRDRHRPRQRHRQEEHPVHRATPANSSLRAYSAGGARSVVDKVDDSKLMQEMAGNFMANETRSAIEAAQNYGFTSVVHAATKDAMGKIIDGAETFMSFIGGNRSFPVGGQHGRPAAPADRFAGRRHRDVSRQGRSAATPHERRRRILDGTGQQDSPHASGASQAAATADATVTAAAVETIPTQMDASGGNGASNGGTQQGQQQQRGQKPVYKDGQKSTTFVDLTKDASRVSGQNVHLKLADGETYVHVDAGQKVYTGGDSSKPMGIVVTLSGPSKNVFARLP